MEDNKEESISLKEVALKIIRLKAYLKLKWKTLFVVTFIGCCLGFLYAYLKKPVYTAECTFVLQDEKSSDLGQYSGLAAMMGIGGLSGGSNSLFSSDNIIELYKSRLMIEKTLLTEVVIGNKRTLLIDRYIDINHLKQKWTDKPQLATINFNIPQKSFTIEHDSILRDVVGDINKNYLTVLKPDKKVSIIKVTVISKDQFFAKSLTETIVKNVNDFYIQASTKKALENLKILQFQVDSIKGVLDRSLGRTASASDATPNANPLMQALHVPLQKSQIDVQANTGIYAESVKDLEIAKITLRKETPLIQIVDSPILPLNVDRVNKILATVIGGIMFFFIALICIILNKIYKSFKSQLL